MTYGAEQIRAWAEAYRRTRNLRAVGALFKVSPNTLARRLREAGVEIKRGRETRPRCPTCGARIPAKAQAAKQT